MGSPREARSQRADMFAVCEQLDHVVALDEPQLLQGHLQREGPRPAEPGSDHLDGHFILMHAPECGEEMVTIAGPVSRRLETSANAIP